MPSFFTKPDKPVPNHEQPPTPRKTGKEYIAVAGKLSEQLSSLETVQKLSAQIQRSLHNVVTDILKRPHLTDDSMKLYELQHARQVAVTRDNEDEESFRQQQIHERSESLELFLAQSPLFHELDTLLEDHSQQLAEAKNAFIKIVAIMVRAEVFADQKNKDERGQVRYTFSSYLPKAADILLDIVREPIGLKQIDGENPIKSADIQKKLAQLQVDLELALVDNNVRKFALLEWVADTARRVKSEGLRIFDTPFYRKLLNRIESIADQRNGLAGILLFGPPGTGKTEALIEANKNQGFDTRVISIHHFSDFVQLIGEKPMPLGLDKKTSHVQRFAIMRDTVQNMRGEEALRFVQNQFETFRQTHKDASWNDFLSFFTPGAEVKVSDSAAQLSVEGAEDVVRALVDRANSGIVSIGLGMKEGVNEEVAWAYGEIIQAFKEGKRVVLDEVDKASEHSLDGISRLLNLSPGQTFSLGTEQYVLPSWSRVDATANEMNLRPFLHDRFYPNLVYVDYPPTQDILQMALVWLSDEQANLKISMDDQAKVIGLMRYVFKEIQEYFPAKLRYPLSLRGLRKFCQVIMQGKSVPDAVNLLLFEPGALAESQEELDLLHELIAPFGAFITPEISAEKEEEHGDQLTNILDSPIYNAVVDSYVPYDVKRHGLTEVQLTTDQRAQLQAENKQQQGVKSIVRPDGLSADITEYGDGKGLVVKLHGEVLFRFPRPDTKDSKLDKNAKILGIDESGNRIAIITANTVYVLEISTKLDHEVYLSSKDPQAQFSQDGSYFFTLDDKRVMINILDTYEDTEGSKSFSVKELHVFSPSGDILEVARMDLVKSGNVLLMEAVTGETYLIDMRLVKKSAGSVRLSKPFSRNPGWRFGANDILYNTSPSEDQMGIGKEKLDTGRSFIVG